MIALSGLTAAVCWLDCMCIPTGGAVVMALNGVVV